MSTFRIHKGFTTSTDLEKAYNAKKLVVATGAFANCFDVLPQKLELTVKTETTLLAKLDVGEANRLVKMPSFIFNLEHPELDSFYMLPPIRYPDGNVYLKLGANTRSDRYLENIEEMRTWMQVGESDVSAKALKEVMQLVVPNLQAQSYETKRCLVSYTPQGYPFIDELEPKLFVALGGNGSSAKSFDALGSLAARLVQTGRWQDHLDADLFKAIKVARKAKT